MEIHDHQAQHDLLASWTTSGGQGYVYTVTLVGSREHYQVELFGPVARGPAEGIRLDHDQFLIDWRKQQVGCPVGCHSEHWGLSHDRHGKETIRVQFSRQDCQRCTLHDQCTKSRARVLLLRPNELAHQALRHARQRQQTPEFRKIYAKRAGIEGTIAQGVRTGEIRRAHQSRSFANNILMWLYRYDLTARKTLENPDFPTNPALASCHL